MVHDMFLVKKQPTGWRAIADLRDCNRWFDVPATFSHPRVQDAFDCERQWATKLDISNAFYKFPVDKELEPMFTFADMDGRPLTYQTLPMGWAWSPALMDAALTCLDVVWGAAELTVVRYADDLFILGRDPEEVERSLRRVITDLITVQAHPSLPKTYAGAFQEIDFLGWHLDLKNARARWDPIKAARLQEDVRRSLEKTGVSTRHLQKVVGKLIFFTTLAPIMRCFLRGVCEEVATREARGGEPHKQMPTSKAAKMDLLFWNDAIPEWTSRWFRDPTPRPEVRRIRIAVDASAVGVGVVMQWNGEARTRSTALTNADVTAASGVREMEAIRCALQLVVEEHLDEPRDEPVDIDIQTDAMIAEHVMRRGSARAAEMVRKMKQIADVIRERPMMVIRTTWVPRDLNTEADAASRAIGSEATLPRRYVEELMRWATGERTPDLDLFATRTNAKAPRFYSRVPDATAVGRDGLRPWPWPAEANTWYAFPPFSLAEHALELWERLQGDRRPGVMILPWRRVAAGTRRAMARGNARMIDPAVVEPPPGARPGW